MVPITIGTTTIKGALLLQVDESKRLIPIQLTAGLPATYPSIDGLFVLVGGGLPRPLVPESRELQFSITSVACFGFGVHCRQLRPWMNVCGGVLCGQPQSEMVGTWQMRLDASLRNDVSVLASESFTVTVVPQIAPTESEADDRDDDVFSVLRLVRPVREIRAYLGEVLSFQFPADMFMYVCTFA